MARRCLKIYLEQEEVDAIKAIVGNRPVSYFEAEEGDDDLSIMFCRVGENLPPIDPNASIGEIPKSHYPFIDISVMPIDEDMDANKLAPLAQLICHAIDNLRQQL